MPQKETARYIVVTPIHRVPLSVPNAEKTNTFWGSTHEITEGQGDATNRSDAQRSLSCGVLKRGGEGREESKRLYNTTTLLPTYFDHTEMCAC